jgi:hypothetical protein
MQPQAIFTRLIIISIRANNERISIFHYQHCLVNFTRFTLHIKNMFINGDVADLIVRYYFCYFETKHNSGILAPGHRLFAVVEDDFYSGRYAATAATP